MGARQMGQVGDPPQPLPLVGYPVKAEQQAGIPRREPADLFPIEPQGGALLPETLLADRRSQVARSGSPVDLEHAAPTQEGKVLFGHRQPRCGFRLERNQGTIAGLDQQVVHPVKVLDVDEDIQVSGELAQGDIAIGLDGQRRALEGQGLDALAGQEVEDAQQPARQPQGGPRIGQVELVEPGQLFRGEHVLAKGLQPGIEEGQYPLPDRDPPEGGPIQPLSQQISQAAIPGAIHADGPQEQLLLRGAEGFGRCMLHDSGLRSAPNSRRLAMVSPHSTRTISTGQVTQEPASTSP